MAGAASNNLNEINGPFPHVLKDKRETNREKCELFLGPSQRSFQRKEPLCLIKALTTFTMTICTAQ